MSLCTRQGLDKTQVVGFNTVPVSSLAMGSHLCQTVAGDRPYRQSDSCRCLAHGRDRVWL